VTAMRIDATFVEITLPGAAELFILVVILLAIGVVGKQPHKYYLHTLIAVGVWFVLFALSAWIADILYDRVAWSFLNFPITGLVYAIPLVIVAAGYERRPIPRLVPRKKG
jgi:hypothetical protein